MAATASRPSTRPLRAIVLVTVGVGVVVGGFLVLGALVGEGFGYFSKEPAETFRVPRYIGWEAYTVVLIEAAGAVSALFAGLVVRRHRGPGMESAFLLGAGGLSALLLVDDFFQLHDYVYARLFGIQEIVVYPVYALLAAAIAWRWGRHVARADVSLVVLAGAWMAVSVGIDQVASKSWAWFHLVEDGAKLMGFTLFAAFLVRTSLRLVADTIAAAASAAASSVSGPAGGEDTVPCTAVRPAARPVTIPAPRTESVALLRPAGRG